MMKNVLILVVCLLSFLAASCRVQAPRSYFNRPMIPPAVNSECYGFQDGERVDTTNWISVSPENYGILEEYWGDKENRLYFCLKYRDCK